MVKLGLIAFCNDGGLGAQTRRLSQMLNPDRIMLIDSSPFSRNKQQHFEWYPTDRTFLASQFPPSNNDVQQFLKGLTHVLVCENPYNFGLVHWGKEQGVKILVQSNYEFCDNLAQPWLPVPDYFLMPSYWKIQEMEKEFGRERVKYLPPPINPAEFDIAREVNLKRTGKKRFVHVIGTGAAEDRNGTFDVLDAMRLSKGDFELVIKSQHNLPMDVFLDDPRVTYEVGNMVDQNDLYKNFDAMLLPRRWGGLCLTMCEALMSGLPVLMTDVSPNKEILPASWLTPSKQGKSFRARSAVIETYSVDHEKYANKIADFANISDQQLLGLKHQAFDIAKENWSFEELKPEYLNFLNNG